MFKNNPRFFINRLFFNIHLFYYNCCVLLKTLQIVFSIEHSFSKTQLVKNTFLHPSQKHLFQKRGVIFCFGQFPLKPHFCSFSWFWLFWAKKVLAQNNSVHENAPFFSLPDTNSVKRFLLKIKIFHFSHVGWPPYKTLFLWGSGAFARLLFSFLLFLFRQHKEDKNKKCKEFVRWNGKKMGELVYRMIKDFSDPSLSQEATGLRYAYRTRGVALRFWGHRTLLRYTPQKMFVCFRGAQGGGGSGAEGDIAIQASRSVRASRSPLSHHRGV